MALIRLTLKSTETATDNIETKQKLSVKQQLLHYFFIRKNTFCNRWFIWCWDPLSQNEGVLESLKNIFKAFRFKIQNFEENVSVPKFWTEKKSSAKVVIYFRDFITHPKFSWNFLHPKKIRNVSDKTSTSSGKWRKSNLVKINYFVATRISIGPLTNKEDIFNQFMEKRDRIFEVKTLTFNTEVTMDIGFQRIITCSKTEFE